MPGKTGPDLLFLQVTDPSFDTLLTFSAADPVRCLNVEKGSFTSDFGKETPRTVFKARIVGKHDGGKFALLAVFRRHERIKPDHVQNEMANTPTLYPLSPIVTHSPDSFGQRGFTKALEHPVWDTIRHDFHS
jgi:hypothetical protein